MSFPFPNPKESGDALRMERSSLTGLAVSSAAYGVHLALFLECLYLLLLRPTEKKIKWHLVVFICMNVVLASINFVTGLKFNELIFIDHRDNVGGPLGVFFYEYGNVWNMLRFAAAFVSNGINDALLIYRLFTFWSHNWRIIAFPCSALVGSCVLATVLLTKIARPTEAFWDKINVELGSSYWALTVVINIYVTAIIVGRIWHLQRQIDQILIHTTPPPSLPKPKSFMRIGRSQEGEKVRDVPNLESQSGLASINPLGLLGKKRCGRISSVTSMLLESAALSTVFGAFAEGTNASNNRLVDIFIPLYHQIIPITSLLIIVRVARRMAWTRNEVIELSNIRFS